MIEKKKRKLWKKVMMILITIPLVITVVLGGLYLYADNKVYIKDGYNSKIITGGEIEAKYLQNGSLTTKKPLQELISLLENIRYIIRQS